MTASLHVPYRQLWIIPYIALSCLWEVLEVHSDCCDALKIERCCICGNNPLKENQSVFKEKSILKKISRAIFYGFYIINTKYRRLWKSVLNNTLMCSEIFRLYRMAVSPCKLHVERTALTQNQIQVHKETETESMNAESSGKFTGKELVQVGHG